MTPGTLAEQPFRDLLDAFAAPTPSPGGGSAAALAAASAAALVGRCASVAARPESEPVCARAAELREELLDLADRDAAVVAALATGTDAIEASGPPALLRAAAQEVATLAGSLERDGARAYRGEARTARVLASAAAAIAQSIIAMNLGRPARGAREPVVDLALPARGRGPQWGMQSIDLNATLLVWPAGAGFDEHRNAERDVLVVVLEGSAALTLDGVTHEIAEHELILVPRGSARALTAGADGVRYLSIHLRREPLLPARRD